MPKRRRQLKRGEQPSVRIGASLTYVDLRTGELVFDYGHGEESRHALAPDEVEGFADLFGAIE